MAVNYSTYMAGYDRVKNRGYDAGTKLTEDEWGALSEEEQNGVYNGLKATYKNGRTVSTTGTAKDNATPFSVSGVSGSGSSSGLITANKDVVAPGQSAWNDDGTGGGISGGQGLTTPTTGGTEGKTPSQAVAGTQDGVTGIGGGTSPTPDVAPSTATSGVATPVQGVPNNPTGTPPTTGTAKSEETVPTETGTGGNDQKMPEILGNAGVGNQKTGGTSGNSSTVISGTNVSVPTTGAQTSSSTSATGGSGRAAAGTQYADYEDYLKGLPGAYDDIYKDQVDFYEGQHSQTQAALDAQEKADRKNAMDSLLARTTAADEARDAAYEDAAEQNRLDTRLIHQNYQNTTEALDKQLTSDTDFYTGQHEKTQAALDTQLTADTDFYTGQHQDTQGMLDAQKAKGEAHAAGVLEDRLGYAEGEHAAAMGVAEDQYGRDTGYVNQTYQTTVDALAEQLKTGKALAQDQYDLLMSMSESERNAVYAAAEAQYQRDTDYVHTTYKTTVDALTEQLATGKALAAEQKQALLAMSESERQAVYAAAEAQYEADTLRETERYSSTIEALVAQRDAGMALAEEQRNLLLNMSTEMRDKVYEAAEIQRKNAYKNAEIERERAAVDAKSAYEQNKASYGANAEAMARMGVTGSGYGDYVNSRAYAESRAEAQRANAQAATVKREADYTETQAKLGADTDFAQNEYSAQATYGQNVYDIDTTYRTNTLAADQARQDATYAGDTTKRNSEQSADAAHRQNQYAADSTYNETVGNLDMSYAANKTDAELARAQGQYSAEGNRASSQEAADAAHRQNEYTATSEYKNRVGELEMSHAANMTDAELAKMQGIYSAEGNRASSQEAADAAHRQNEYTATSEYNAQVGELDMSYAANMTDAELARAQGQYSAESNRASAEAAADAAHRQNEYTATSEYKNRVGELDMAYAANKTDAELARAQGQYSAESNRASAEAAADATLRGETYRANADYDDTMYDIDTSYAANSLANDQTLEAGLYQAGSQHRADSLANDTTRDAGVHRANSDYNAGMAAAEGEKLQGNYTAASNKLTAENTADAAHRTATQEANWQYGEDLYNIESNVRADTLANDLAKNEGIHQADVSNELNKLDAEGEALAYKQAQEEGKGEAYKAYLAGAYDGTYSAELLEELAADAGFTPAQTKTLIAAAEKHANGAQAENNIAVSDALGDTVGAIQGMIDSGQLSAEDGAASIAKIQNDNFAAAKASVSEALAFGYDVDTAEIDRMVASGDLTSEQRDDLAALWNKQVPVEKNAFVTDAGYMDKADAQAYVNEISGNVWASPETKAALQASFDALYKPSNQGGGMVGTLTQNEAAGNDRFDVSFAGDEFQVMTDGKVAGSIVNEVAGDVANGNLFGYEGEIYMKYNGHVYHICPSDRHPERYDALYESFF